MASKEAQRVAKVAGIMAQAQALTGAKQSAVWDEPTIAKFSTFKKSVGDEGMADQLIVQLKRESKVLRLLKVATRKEENLIKRGKVSAEQSQIAQLNEFSASTQEKLLMSINAMFDLYNPEIAARDQVLDFHSQTKESMVSCLETHIPRIQAEINNGSIDCNHYSAHIVQIIVGEGEGTLRKAAVNWFQVNGHDIYLPVRG